MTIPYNLPVTDFSNLFEQDPTGRAFFESWLGSALFKKAEPHFSKMGEAGALATPLADQADKESPKLNKFNSRGERIDQVSYHPSYQRLRELSYGQGIISVKYEAGQDPELSKNRQLYGFGAAYYFAQTETGLFCPICMTDALARVLEIHGQSPEAKEALHRLTTQDLTELWEGAMFLTERQGGSDVGANIAEAKQKEGRWYLEGHKWFCSNVDAGAALVLARMPGEEGAVTQGTRGLGLFLVLRNTPTDNWKSWEVHRLKEKLGVRSMASGEITFSGTEAFLIGGAGQGFKQMADMVNMSRLYNSISSVAIARRAVLEAMEFGRKRKAFGAEVKELPLWRTTMADLIAEQWGLFLLVFECVKALDLADHGDEEAKAFVRFLTPITKASSGNFSVFVCSQAMEAIGGNAYIEEHILPRLYRDAQVLPIWEGTSNIQSLDLLRVLTKEGAGSFVHKVESLLAEAKTNLSREQFAKLEERHREWQATLDELAKAPPEQNQRRARQWLDQTSRLLTLCLIAKDAKGPLKGVMLACFDRVLVRPSATSPLALDTWNLVDGEEAILGSV